MRSEVDIVRAWKEARRIAAHEATDMYEVLSPGWHSHFEQHSRREYDKLVRPQATRCETCGR